MERRGPLLVMAAASLSCCVGGALYYLRHHHRGQEDDEHYNGTAIFTAHAAQRSQLQEGEVDEEPDENFCSSSESEADEGTEEYGARQRALLRRQRSREMAKAASHPIPSLRPSKKRRVRCHFARRLRQLHAELTDLHRFSNDKFASAAMAAMALEEEIGRLVEGGANPRSDPRLHRMMMEYSDLMQLLEGGNRTDTNTDDDDDDDSEFYDEDFSDGEEEAMPRAVGNKKDTFY
eukprot:PhM_4_TR15654/c3_g3_i1/m.61318